MPRPYLVLRFRLFEKMKITSGKYEVLTSGSVMSYGDDPISFELDQETTVSFKFKNDPNVGDSKIDYEIDGNHQLDLILTNFTNPLGVGLIKPLSVGDINGRALFLNFRVHSTTDDNHSKLLSYTWYLGDSKPKPV